jgi:hypothetical protein
MTPNDKLVAGSHGQCFSDRGLFAGPEQKPTVNQEPVDRAYPNC